MKVYYHYSKNEIMTEEEAREYAEVQVDGMSCKERLASFPPHVLWDMLSEEAQKNIIEQLIEDVYDEEFEYREIEVKENGSI